MNRRLGLAIFLLAISGSPQAQALKDATPTLTVGNWTILRAQDNMTDEVICTGIYKDDYGIQLNDDALYLTLRGVPEGITLRFNDEPARPFRLAEDIERRIGSVIIKGADFNRLVGASRLRAEISTLVRGMRQFDLDTNGIDKALQHIKADCPLPPDGSVLQIPAEPASRCNAELTKRLKDVGVSEQQIAAACQQ